MSVLIVEDDKDIRDALVEVLEIEGISTVGVGNGQEGLDYLRASNVPEVILLDLMMPVKDGIQFLTEQQADSAISKIPVVIMSADNEAQKKRLAFPNVRYLKKPIDIELLLTTLKPYIN